MNDLRTSFLASVTVLSLAACGGSVAPEAPTPADPITPSTAWTETASCTVIQASCGGAPALAVRGHAEGLVGLDGARVEFAVRYIEKEGEGLDVPHGVALGRTQVKDGAFETCVCVPTGAGMYPQIAAVVYGKGAPTTLGRDAVRAMYSQRYATLGDEDLAWALGAEPSAATKETAVAAMAKRNVSSSLEGLGSVEGLQVVAGLVAEERPIAAQMAFGGIEGGKVALKWTMPGAAYPSERIAFFVDKNKNGKCDAGDAGGFSAPGLPVKTLLEGAALTPVCAAISADVPRE